ncbi:hypothetical protein U9M48_020826 [Paspalum notatum var. saurae]|uniref:DUF674 domain-containing protein n=1 Tax=Paspalum notatum var. saurae TaxID=547442 RepID=A0AAQ3WT80_PASNO
MKLLVDTKAHRVLYADASKHVVDFLFSFLTLPVGTVLKMLSKGAMVGCIGNLYGSVEKLDSAYLRSADAKKALLSPAGGRDLRKLLQLPGPGAAVPAAAMKFYLCSNLRYDNCDQYAAAVSGTNCRHCRGKMDDPIEIVGSSLAALDGMGFVKEAVTYTVMYNLKVVATSPVSGIFALKALGVRYQLAAGRDSSCGVQRVLKEATTFVERVKKFPR